MKTKLINLWYLTSKSFWFAPALTAAMAVIVSFITGTLDQYLPKTGAGNLWWLYSGGAEGARQVLSTIAGSMITVAGVVFSITIVVLSLTSSQFGPRLMRNFMEDRGNQLVLGVFIATFLYCLLALRQIKEHLGATAAPPHLSVTVGLIMALVSLGVLIYFIHHISASIQANNLLANIARNMDRAIARLFPDRLGGELVDEDELAQAELIPLDFDRRSAGIKSDKTGYLQLISFETLKSVAREYKVIVRLERRVGHFIVEGAPLARVWPLEAVDKKLGKKINDAFILGYERTGAQDVEFIFNQLGEAALRALSPGINDPFTALTCLDWIGSGLTQLCERRPPSRFHFDENKNLRVITIPVTFAGIADAALNQIRQSARPHAAVSIRMLEIIAAIGERVSREEDRQTLIRHAEMILRGCMESITLDEDKSDIADRYETARKALMREAA